MACPCFVTSFLYIEKIEHRLPYFGPYRAEMITQIALCNPSADPIFSLSPLAIHTRNLLADPRCTLVVQVPPTDCSPSYLMICLCCYCPFLLVISLHQLNCLPFELQCGLFWGQSTFMYTKLRVRYKLKYMCLICTQHQLEYHLEVTSVCLNYCVWWQFITLVFVTCDDRSQDGVDWQMQGSHYLETCIHFLTISR